MAALGLFLTLCRPLQQGGGHCVANGGPARVSQSIVLGNKGGQLFGRRADQAAVHGLVYNVR
jgi:hypothetical protein